MADIMDVEDGGRLSFGDGLALRRRGENRYFELRLSHDGEPFTYKLGTTDELSVDEARRWTALIRELNTPMERAKCFLELRATVNIKLGKLDEPEESTEVAQKRWKPRPDLGLDWTPDLDWWWVQGEKTLLTSREHIEQLLGTSELTTMTVFGFRCVANWQTGYGFALQPNRDPKYPTFGRRVIRDDHWFEEEVENRTKIRDRKRKLDTLTGGDIL